MADSKLRDENYYLVYGWMVNRLKLNVYAIIYGFSQDGENEYTGMLQYLCDLCGGVSRSTISKALKELVDEKLILRREETISNVIFVRYRANLELAEISVPQTDTAPVKNVECTPEGGKKTLPGVVKKFDRGSKETLPPAVKELDPTGKETLPKKRIKASTRRKNDSVKQKSFCILKKIRRSFFESPSAKTDRDAVFTDEFYQYFEDSPAGHPALGHYRIFINEKKNCAGMLSGLATRLQLIENSDLGALVSGSPYPDENVNTEAPARRRCIYFVTVPDTDNTMYFLSATFFTLLMANMTKYADKQPNNKCKHPVEIIMDEAAQLGRISGLGQKASSMRSREIRLTLAVQQIAQFQYLDASLKRNRYIRNLDGSCLQDRNGQPVHDPFEGFEARWYEDYRTEKKAKDEEMHQWYLDNPIVSNTKSVQDNTASAEPGSPPDASFRTDDVGAKDFRTGSVPEKVPAVSAPTDLESLNRPIRSGRIEATVDGYCEDDDEEAPADRAGQGVTPAEDAARTADIPEKFRTYIEASKKEKRLYANTKSFVDEEQAKTMDKFAIAREIVARYAIVPGCTITAEEEKRYESFARRVVTLTVEMKSTGQSKEQCAQAIALSVLIIEEYLITATDKAEQSRRAHVLTQIQSSKIPDQNAYIILTKYRKMYYENKQKQ